MHRTRNRQLGLGVLVLALGLIAAACGGGAGAGTPGSGLSVRIASPSDGGSVTQPFIVRLDANVPLGDPSTGRNHVHLCFDGKSCDSEYTLVFGDTFEVTDLAPGQHTIEASLRNADHSDAGPSDSITVTVAAGGTGAPGTGISGAGTGADGPSGSGASGRYGS